MQITFSFPFRPILHNNARKIMPIGHSKSQKALLKTKECRMFESVLLESIAKQALTFTGDIEQFIEEKGERSIRFEMYIYSPDFITKKGTINKRGGDWDGFIKIIQDVLFEFLGLDDSQIMTGYVEKIYAEKDKTVIILS